MYFMEIILFNEEYRTEIPRANETSRMNEVEIVYYLWISVFQLFLFNVFPSVNKKTRKTFVSSTNFIEKEQTLEVLFTDGWCRIYSNVKLEIEIK